MKQRTLEEFLDGLNSATTIPELENVIYAMRDRFEAQHLLYHWINAEGELFGAGTYDDAWRDHYLSNDFQKHDPVVKAAYQRFHPLNWSTLDWSSKGARRLRDDAQSAGVGAQGLTVPIRGPNGQFAHFTATMDGDDTAWADFTERNARDLILLGHFVNQKALDISKGNEEEPGVALSPREIDALTMLALGYTRGQAADALTISEHTLRVYIESARFKLHSMNTTHAVAQAMKLGLLVI